MTENASLTRPGHSINVKQWPKPTRQEILAARGKKVPDVIAPGLKILFCGINPGLYTAAVGHHFARPGNRFWPALHKAGFTSRQLSPFEERELLELGYGVTNVVNRATASADELNREDLIKGARQLQRKVLKCEPVCLAVLGLGAYRAAFERPRAKPGRQDQTIGRSLVWVLPNPSGLNANYQIADLVRLFRELRNAIE
jgi:double-stranded uracil-DNA glycosylase